MADEGDALNEDDEIDLEKYKKWKEENVTPAGEVSGE